MTVVSLFAGPGGACQGIFDATGQHPVGLEHGADEVATRDAAGHVTVHADLFTFTPCDLDCEVDGLWASPPCPAFSTAGARKGMADIDRLVALAHDPTMWDRTCREDWNDESSELIMSTLRWVDHHRPRWVVFEQVPPVLPVWQAALEGLKPLGYTGWAGVLNCADYGVPQTRKRAFLIVTLDGVGEPPDPTHAQDPQPTLFGQPLAPWVSMAEALGWRPGKVGFPRRDDLGTSPTGYRERDFFDVDGAAPTVTEKGRSWVRQEIAAGDWVLNTGLAWKKGGDRDDAQKLDLDQPAPTVTALAGTQWQLRPGSWADGRGGNRRTYDSSEPAPTINFGHDAAGWVWERPATTITGDPRISQPGRHDLNARGHSQQYGPNPIRCTVDELAVLQSFPTGYPFQGTKTSQFRQVGNAVPPLLAQRIVEQFYVR